MHALNEKNRIGIAGLGVVDQVKASFVKRNRLAMACGFVLGGFVPVASFVIAHNEAMTEGRQWMWVAVIGGLGYSALTVFNWSKTAFRSPWKAASFCVLIEFVMTASNQVSLAYAGLFLLIAINGIATGCQLVADQKESRKRR